MSATIVPMQLGDIFDRTFRIAGRAFKRNIVITIVLLTIPAVILVAGLHMFYSSIGQAAVTSKAAVTDLFRTLGLFFTISLGMLIFFLGYLSAQIAVTLVAAGEISETPVTWSEAIRQTLGRKLGSAVGQSILQALAIGGMVMFPFIVIAIGSVVKSVMASLLGLLLLLVMVPLAIRFWIRWSMVLPSIAWEGEGALGSFGRSESLVDGSWWRVFGILLLLWIATQFAVTLITTPITFAALWNWYGEYFKALSNAGNGTALSPEITQRLLSSMGIGMGFSMCLSTMLPLLIQPVYTAVLYFDLRARRGEFSTMEESVSGPQGAVL